jgi:hypothetical protein
LLADFSESVVGGLPMARKRSVLEFRKPRRRHVAVRRRPSKFLPAGRMSTARTPTLVSPALRIWMMATVLLLIALLVGLPAFRFV